MPLVVTVFRRGKDFTEEHVKWIGRQLPEGVRYACISENPIEGVEFIPLRYGWPGWWSKMEMFQIQEPFLFLDLDTAVLDDLSFILDSKEPLVLSDWYHPHIINSSVMFITPDLGKKIWDEWIKDPDSHMRNHGHQGDQGFVSTMVNDVERIQNKYPGKFVSYKVSVVGRHQDHYSHRSTGDGTVPAGVSVVCFHGKPRPWDLTYNWIPK